MTLGDLGSGKAMVQETGTVIAHILGPTCAGKTTLLDRAGTGRGCVSIGRILRAKYKPEDFKGRGNTFADEAWSLYLSEVGARLRLGRYRRILVDGMPRDVDQVERVLAAFPGVPKKFLLLDAPTETLLRRATLRSASPAEYELARQRTANDIPDLYATLFALLRAEQTIVVIPTDRPLDVWLHEAWARLGGR